MLGFTKILCPTVDFRAIISDSCWMNSPFEGMRTLCGSSSFNSDVYSTKFEAIRHSSRMSNNSLPIASDKDPSDHSMTLLFDSILFSYYIKSAQYNKLPTLRNEARLFGSISLIVSLAPSSSCGSSESLFANLHLTMLSTAQMFISLISF